MIWNLTKRTILSRRPVSAIGPFMRMRGMIARDFSEFDAMVFSNCACIHTCFMSISIDAVFLSEGNKVSSVRKSLEPWHPFVGAKDSTIVIELPEGAIAKSGTELGDILDLNAELCEPEKLLAKRFEPPIAPETAIPLRKE